MSFERNGFRFRFDGCYNCVRELWECPGCCYFESNFNLPRLNPYCDTIQNNNIDLTHMRKKAREALKQHNKSKEK